MNATGDEWVPCPRETVNAMMGKTPKQQAEKRAEYEAAMKRYASQQVWTALADGSAIALTGTRTRIVRTAVPEGVRYALIENGAETAARVVEDQPSLRRAAVAELKALAAPGGAR